MARFGLIGPAYASEASVADAETLVNWYIETMESSGARSSAVYYPRRGLIPFADLLDSPVRGQIEVNGRHFAVGGGKFCEIASDGTVTTRGLVANDGKPVSMANSAQQIIIVAAGNAYCFTLNGNSFAAINGINTSLSYTIRAAAPAGLRQLANSVAVTTATQSGTLVTLTLGAWFPQPSDLNAPDDPVVVAGVGVAGYNGTFPIVSIDYGQFNSLGSDAIASISESSTTVTLSTSVHSSTYPKYWDQLQVGDTITISDVPISGYNGQHTVTGKTITWVSAHSRWDFEVTYTAIAGLGPSSGGTVQYGIVIYPTITYNAGASGLANSSGGTATLYYLRITNATDDPMLFLPGESVTVAGADNAAYNGLWIVGTLQGASIACHPKLGLLGIGDSQNGTVSESGGLPVMVDYCDGYFIMLMDSYQRWRLSGLMDGLTWDGLDVSQVSTIPDDLVSIKVDHREAWLFGAKKTVVYYNSGNPDFPFDVVSGGFIEQGCAARFSPCRLDNSIFWLGRDERGALVAWRANGYLPSRVSNHAIEDEWQDYATNTDAISYTYQCDGHSFWAIYFPTENKTWVFDAATGTWHRETFNDGGATRAQNHAFAFGKHLAGDWNSGTIFEMSDSSDRDIVGGTNYYIRRERTCPSISVEQQWVAHEKLQIDVQVGIDYVPLNSTINHYPACTVLTPNPVSPGVPTGNYTIKAVQFAEVTCINIIGYTDDVSVTISAANTGFRTTTPAPLVPGSEHWRIYISSDNWATAQWYPSSGGTVNIYDLSTLPHALPAFANFQREPQINIHWSDDGTRTWSNTHTLNCGAKGAYRTRVILRRLGRSRNRIYQIWADDPIPWRIIEGYVTASPGFSPMERLSKAMGKQA